MKGNLNSPSTLLRAGRLKSMNSRKLKKELGQGYTVRRRCSSGVSRVITPEGHRLDFDRSWTDESAAAAMVRSKIPVMIGPNRGRQMNPDCK